MSSRTLPGKCRSNAHQEPLHNRQASYQRPRTLLMSGRIDAVRCRIINNELIGVPSPDYGELRHALGIDGTQVHRVVSEGIRSGIFARTETGLVVIDHVEAAL